MSRPACGNRIGGVHQGTERMKTTMDRIMYEGEKGTEGCVSFRSGTVIEDGTRGGHESRAGAW